ncbi:MAG: ABC transporter substrate-binding protein [Actinomycetota bacterium]
MQEDDHSRADQALDRRRFLAAGGLTAAGVVLASCSSGDTISATPALGSSDSSADTDETAAGTDADADAGTDEDQPAEATPVSEPASSLPVVEWEMASSWVETLPTLWASNVHFADRVAALTDGRFSITPKPAGELTGALEVLPSVQTSAVSLGTTASYYYMESSPITAFGTAVPFGLTTRQQLAWLYAGGGLELLQGLYAEKFNIIQFPVASTGAQMGGWFNREIQSLTDLAGLTMRIPGLGGQVMSSLGVQTENLAASEIGAALESGQIDAAEFIGPSDDKNLGLQDSGQFYYYPGFWEPCALAEVQINLDQWNALPESYREAIRTAAAETTSWSMALYDARNGLALNELVAGGTELRIFPDDVLGAAQAASGLLLDEIAAGDEDFARVLEHWRNFRRQVAPWFSLAEAALLR